MNAEFNWWLLIVGLGIGAGLAWLVLADMGRRRDAMAEQERTDEIAWIESTLRDEGVAADSDVVGRVLDLHDRWLEPSPTAAREAAARGPDEALIEAADPGTDARALAGEEPVTDDAEDR
jgi:hypothetical protein